MKDLSEKILEIVDETNKLNSSADSKVSTLLSNAIRIARLRNDFINLWWLRLEESGIKEQEHKKEILKEVRPHITSQQLEDYYDLFRERRIEVMSIDILNTDTKKIKTTVVVMSIPEIEQEIHSLEFEIKEIKTPEGLSPDYLYRISQSNDDTKDLLIEYLSEYKKLGD